MEPHRTSSARLSNHNRLSRTRSLSRSRSPSRRCVLHPIITIAPDCSSSFPQLIATSSAPTSPRLAVLLPPENLFHSEHDLPPRYDQLDLPRPPSYQEAIKKG